MRLRLALLVSVAFVALTTPAAAAVPASSLRTIAGGGSVAANTVPSEAPFPAPTDVALTRPGDVSVNTIVPQVAFADGNRIFMVEGGALKRIAGTGDPGCAGDGEGAASATLNGPTGLQYDDAGLMFADSGCHRIRHVFLAGGNTTTITRVAGNTSGFAEGDALTAALFKYPADVEPFGFANLLVADSENRRVRKIDGGNVTTVAGDPNAPLPSNSEPLSDATGADIGSPGEVSAIGGGAYLIASYYNGITGGRIYRVAGDGKIERVTGGGAETADGELAKDTHLEFVASVRGLPDGGFLYLESHWNTATFTNEWRIRRVRADDTVMTIASGVGTPGGLERAREGLYFSHQDPDLVRLMPATEITSGPSGSVGSSSAAFSLASWDENATFECSLDNAFSAPCDETPDFSGLADGRHTLYVNATAGGQTDFSSTLREWFVDTSPPAAFGLLEPAEAATAPERPTFSWQPTADANTEGNAGLARYEIWIGDAKAGDVEPSACASTCSFTPAAALADGARTWEVRAIDGVGNVRASGRRNVTIVQPPVAQLAIAPTRSLVNRAVTFDASGSTDSNGGIVRFEWDLDGNGSFEVDSGAEPRSSRSFGTPATFNPAVRVTDTGGLTAVATGTLVVTSPPPAGLPLGVSINDGARFTNDPDVVVHSVWPAFASNMLVSNDGGFRPAETFPVGETTPWKLDSSGSERLPKTIYVRFFAGLQTSETYQDDIILDQTAPRILTASLRRAASSALATAARTNRRRLRIRARDNASGVARMQVTKSKRRPGRARRFKRAVTVPAKGRVWVRVRDNAKNWSRWRRAR